MATKKNIIVGAASLYLGDALESATPTNIGTWRPAFAAGSYRDTIGADAAWAGVGYTQEGLEVSYEPDFGEVEVDQLLDAAKMFKQGMTVSINTTLAEATLENLLIAWGQSADSHLVGDGTTVADPDIEGGATFLDAEEEHLQMEGGSLGEAPNEKGLVAVGNGPEVAGSNAYKERVYSVYRVLSVEASSFALRRNEATVFPVSFRALPEDSAGRYGSVRDRVLA